MFANKGTKPLNNGSFFPINESEYDLIALINDSSKQYYTLTNILFKKHLIELRGEDYYVTISPAAIISRGTDLIDTNDRSLFQNTRGIHAEGDLFKNFSFSTSFFENQTRVTYFEDSYYRALGELYKKPTYYQTQNAVIPGMGRTKPFKTDGFDYAYAMGYVAFQAHKNLRISSGNNPQFVGDGYRSVLLSDNSFCAPYFRIDWIINKLFRFTYHRARLMNLLRKPVSSSAESYYESKGYSVNYFTYSPTEDVSISLFEGSIWNRGDSIESKFSHPLYYNPLPFLSPLALKDKNEVASLLGLNLSYQLADHHRVYGQLAINNLDKEKFAWQLGYRGYNYFGLNDFMLQIEINHVAPHAYEVQNRRLNYSHFNLPLAHSKGNGFNEFILRSSYEIKRIYFDIKSIQYFAYDFHQRSLLPIYEDLEFESFSINNTSLEIGYRVNRKMNLCVFGRATFRTTDQLSVDNATILEGGLSTYIFNNYRDF